MKLMRALRFTSIAEGISFLLLVGVAMPLKYGFGHDIAVKIAGPIHGALFLALLFLILQALLHRGLPFKTAFLTGLASLLPAGPFFADRLLRRHEQQLSISDS